ncbi:hypothetical protein B6N60_01274 [Richelia sinica FACHB-800]|uniref:Lipoprotein n=1 Tax=Richelia sinica FACHB-800 TaxID=1357546 RepID=A0A975Y3X7_9NOST|nr:hypothetical protein [Richelia sinica]MBD2664192.1 hypothetical protein [Richelia sinica FACHB-800]QXE22591.1 hypothetical protein B6N60_01274 [Richelia sinica FACHB-800]
MSIAMPKTYSWWEIVSAITTGVSTAMILSGCGNMSHQSSEQKWQTYSNSRYKFEFPYPSHWQSLKPPDNRDGITLVSPQNPTVEIRAWATNNLFTAETESRNTQNINYNFQTNQGLPGVMMVEVGQQVSTIKLTITQGKVKYYWQGQSNSKEFQNYYHMFYYIAKQYQVK